MTREDKELLLKDLCARLPYGVVCADRYVDEKFTNTNKWNVLAIDGIEQVCISNCEKIYGYKTSITNIKPYLFPISSMTDEQKREEYEICKEYIIGYESDLIDFYNRNHIDYRGLIAQDLAIDATGLNIY